ncbi:hypothetical protein PBI_LAUER_29 [Gordonia phage Lauer]|uniref:Minor tail protein n=1 Tax=Gordonia phage Lauer TaxID=2656538 RepID=A0A649VIK5_9CAUD|nr:hypothetical protein PP995_gp29 [Gordonia phage Lauer]QGJ92138.1 hypothetical protein PBI_LAUER_29 [Gordonia phage Lauer]
MIGAAVRRARRSRGGGGPRFLTAAGAAGNNSVATASITVDQNCVLVIGAAYNGTFDNYGIGAVTVNGSPAILVGSSLISDRNNYLYIASVPAGTHSVVLPLGGYRTLVVAAYAGVDTSVKFPGAFCPAGYAYYGGSPLSVSPYGAGEKAVSVIETPDVLTATAWGTGATARIVQQSAAVTNYSLALVESDTPPIVMAPPSINAWSAGTIWLDPTYGARQKAVQPANVGDPAGNKVKIPFMSDSAHPSATADHDIVVQGSGTRNIVLSANGGGGIFANVRLTLERNGVAVGSLDIADQSNARTKILSEVELTHGDRLALYAERIAYSSIGGDTRNALIDIQPYSFLRQQINKDVFQSFGSSSNVVATMTSDATYPATVVNNGIEVAGTTSQATIHAFIKGGRNNISGNAIFDLHLNGVAVDSYTLTPVQQMANNSTSPAQRPIRLQWTGSIAAGDDIQLIGRRTVSTSGMWHPGTHVYIEPGNTTYTMQAMYKNTSGYSLSTTQSTVTGWVADSTKYTGSSVNASHQLVTTLVGTGGVRAHIACDSGAAVSDFRLMMNGTEIGSVTIPASDQSGYWIDVPNITFDGSDLIWLTASRPGSSRNVVANLSVIEAYVNN